jgi:hypothetical protein
MDALRPADILMLHPSYDDPCGCGRSSLIDRDADGFLHSMQIERSGKEGLFREEEGLFRGRSGDRVHRATGSMYRHLQSRRERYLAPCGVCRALRTLPTVLAERLPTVQAEQSHAPVSWRRRHSSR